LKEGILDEYWVPLGKKPPLGFRIKLAISHFFRSKLFLRAIAVILALAFLAGMILSGERPPRARALVSLGDGTYIGPNDTTYENQDIRIAGNVTIDGSHTFNTLQVWTNGVLTHSAVDSNGRLSPATETKRTAVTFVGQVAVAMNPKDGSGKLCTFSDDRNQVQLTKIGGPGIANGSTFNIGDDGCVVISGLVSTDSTNPTIFGFLAHYLEWDGLASFNMYGWVRSLTSGSWVYIKGVTGTTVSGTYYRDANDLDNPEGNYGGTQYFGPIQGEEYGAEGGKAIATSASGGLYETAIDFFNRNWGYGIVGPLWDAGSKMYIRAKQRIEILGQVDVAGKGYIQNPINNGSGYGPGGGSGGADDWEGAGGSYGGVGGSEIVNQPRGPTYGSETYPDDFGSSGGNNDGGGGTAGTGGAGGGIIHLESPIIIVEGTNSNTGVLRADGNTAVSEGLVSDGGGGAGGSIYLQGDYLEISNSQISAQGGDTAGLHPQAGAGGGGRVAFVYKSSNLSKDALRGSPHVEGGINSAAMSSWYNGSEGTVYVGGSTSGISTGLQIYKSIWDQAGSKQVSNILTGQTYTIKLEVLNSFAVAVIIEDNLLTDGNNYFTCIDGSLTPTGGTCDNTTHKVIWSNVTLNASDSDNSTTTFTYQAVAP